MLFTSDPNQSVTGVNVIVASEFNAYEPRTVEPSRASKAVELHKALAVDVVAHNFTEPVTSGAVAEPATSFPATEIVWVEF